MSFAALRLTAFTAAAIAGASLHSPAGAQEKDNSGTNPTTINRSFNLVNDYRDLPRGKYGNTTSIRFNEPLFDGRAGLRFLLPYQSSNAPGRSFDGIGDISAKMTWVAHLDRQQGLVFTGEVFAPTASERVLGSGRWMASPGVTYAWFVNSEIIVAPAVIYTASFAAPERRRGDVRRTDLDLYVVYKQTGANWWLTSDLTVSFDHVAKATPMSYKLALGTTLGKLPGGGAVNLSLRPGVGFGPDRPFRWSFEASLALVGF